MTKVSPPTPCDQTLTNLHHCDQPMTNTTPVRPCNQPMTNVFPSHRYEFIYFGIIILINYSKAFIMLFSTLSVYSSLK